jgi:glycogen debranching enzyme
VIPKWLPCLDKWPPYFEQIAAQKYTAIHFAPLQERGVSDSPYSIRNQLNFAPDLFGEELPAVEQNKRVESLLKDLRKKHGLRFVTDIVWNHTACDSPWLCDHPDAGILLILSNSNNNI